MVEKKLDPGTAVPAERAPVMAPGLPCYAGSPPLFGITGDGVQPFENTR